MYDSLLFLIPTKDSEQLEMTTEEKKTKNGMTKNPSEVITLYNIYFPRARNV